MSKSIDQIDVQQLTKDAEALKGCSILDAFDGLSMQDQIATVRQISALNKEHRSEDKGLPKINTFHYVDGGRYGDGLVHLSVVKENDGAFTANTSLFRESLDVSKAKIKYDCTDLNSTEIVSRSKETSF